MNPPKKWTRVECDCGTHDLPTDGVLRRIYDDHIDQGHRIKSATQVTSTQVANHIWKDGGHDVVSA